MASVVRMLSSDLRSDYSYVKLAAAIAVFVLVNAVIALL